MFKNHKYVNAGKCPFTNNVYQVCIRCENMVAI